jgi:hypothetical protein
MKHSSDKHIVVPIRLDKSVMDCLNRIAVLAETDVSTVINMIMAMSVRPPAKAPVKRRKAKKK